MSFHGGRGGTRGGSTIGGGLLHLDLKPDFGPTDLYPESAQPIRKPLTMFEKQAVSQFLGLKNEIKDGPLYTGSNKKKSRVVIEVDRTFDDDIKRYSDRYRKKRKIGRSIDEHPYIIEFFPEELHSAMGLTSNKLKRVDISKFTSELLKVEDKNKRELLELKLNNMQEDDKDEKEEEEEEEEEEEGDFEEDEDDDYNAERYFENGEDYDNDDDCDDEAAY